MSSLRQCCSGWRTSSSSLTRCLVAEGGRRPTKLSTESLRRIVANGAASHSYTPSLEARATPACGLRWAAQRIWVYLAFRRSGSPTKKRSITVADSQSHQGRSRAAAATTRPTAGTAATEALRIST